MMSGMGTPHLCIAIPTLLADELVKELRQQMNIPNCKPCIGKLLALIEGAEKNSAPTVSDTTPTVRPPLLGSLPSSDAGTGYNFFGAHNRPLIPSTSSTIIEPASTAGMSSCLPTLPLLSGP